MDSDSTAPKPEMTQEEKLAKMRKLAKDQWRESFNDKSCEVTLPKTLDELKIGLIFPRTTN